MLSLRQFASGRAAKSYNTAASWIVTDPIPEEIHTAYAIYLKNIKTELERIAATPWSTQLNAFKWSGIGEAMRIDHCGCFTRNSDGLYNYEGEKYVMVQTAQFPTVMILQCVSKPSPDNVATLHFGYHCNGTYDLRRYEGPACEAASYQSLDNGKTTIQVKPNRTTYTRGNLRSCTVSNGEVNVCLDCPICKCRHIVTHTSLRDKLVFTHREGSATFKFVDHRWTLVKMVAE